jgi:nucleotide-binding universal stress UspA family protein
MVFTDRAVRGFDETEERRPLLVVVHDDGSEDGDALALAGRLADLQDAPILVVQVLRETRSRDPNPDRTARLRLAQARASVAAVLPGRNDVEFLPLAGPSPHRQVHAVALERNAQLIVAGSEHDGAQGRVRLDRRSASTVVLNSPCPVAVAPNGFGARPAPGPLSIGVAFDGAPESVAALQSAHALARAVGGALRVIAVEADQPDSRAADAVATLGREIPIELTVEHGDPAARLAQASQELDLLVCASRGRRPLRRLALGRVPLMLMRSAACPLLIVAPGVPLPSPQRSIA